MNEALLRQKLVKAFQGSCHRKKSTDGELTRSERNLIQDTVTDQATAGRVRCISEVLKALKLEHAHGAISTSSDRCVAGVAING